MYDRDAEIEPSYVCARTFEKVHFERMFAHRFTVVTSRNCSYCIRARKLKRAFPASIFFVLFLTTRSRVLHSLEGGTIRVIADLSETKPELNVLR